MLKTLDKTRSRDIPVLDVGPDFPYETLVAEEARAHRLIEGATGRAPKQVLRALDKVSRRWLARWDNAHLAEIDRIAARLGRPGVYFLSVNYEWGCTCRVGASPDGATARLIRVLDWRTPGLGRNILAARVNGAAGSFVTMTWPGYTGVLQGMAPGRFSAALNQAPMRAPLGVYGIDWAANRVRVWNMTHETPSHVLREVFETATSYEEARKQLTERPLSTPAIFLLAGLRSKETVMIERTETDAHVHEGDQIAANHWQAPGWQGRARGTDSGGRAGQMARVTANLDTDFDWLKAPILNPRTRLAMVADAAEGRLVTQGVEETGPVTNVLKLETSAAFVH